MSDTKEEILDISNWSLEEFAMNEGTELGEYWQALVDLWQRRDFMPEPLKEQVEKAMADELKYCKEKMELVRTVETREVSSVELRDKDNY